MDQCSGLDFLHTMKVEDLFAISSSDPVSWECVVSLFAFLQKNEVAFMHGVSLMDSTHRCIFMWQNARERLQDREDLPSRVVITFCKAFVHTLSLIFSSLLSADIFEGIFLFIFLLVIIVFIDEDFCAAFRHYLDSEEDGSLLSNLNSLISELSDDEFSQVPPTVREVLVKFLSVRKQELLFYSSLDSLLKTTISEATKKIKTRQSGDDAASLLSSVSLDSPSIDISGFSALISLNQQLLFDLQGLKESFTRFLGTIEIKSELPLLEIAESVFCRDHLSKLVMNGPKRDVEIGTFAFRIDQEIDLHKQLEELYSNFFKDFPFFKRHMAPAVLDITNLPFEDIFWKCSAISSKRYHVIVRSYHVGLLHLFGVNIDRFLYNSLRYWKIPDKVIGIKALPLEWIKGTPSIAAWDLLRLTTINRNKLYCRMDLLFSVWGNVATESLYLDERINEEIAADPSRYSDLIALAENNGTTTGPMYWFATWSVIHTTMIMNLFMKLTVEMDVLEIKEYDYFYWYWDYILSTHLYSIDKIKSQIIQLNKKRFLKKKEEFAAFLREFPSSKDSLVRGCGQVCRGLFRLVISCKLLHIIPSDSFGSSIPSFTSNAMVFASRFKSFQEIINPNALSYHDYMSAISKDIDQLTNSSSNSKASAALQVLNSSILCFQQAKTILDEARKQNPSSSPAVDVIKVMQTLLL
jgi:hypothetical protein